MKSYLARASYLLLLVILSLTQSAIGSSSSLTLEDRVQYQQAVEQVYWKHRIWPAANQKPKPSLEQVMPDSAIRAQVEDTMRLSNALEKYWNRPVTFQQLQNEINRMIKQSKQPAMLREIFSALGDDPAMIAEIVARPVLVRRLARNLYATDSRLHQDVKQKAETDIERVRNADSIRFDTWWKETSSSLSAEVLTPAGDYRLDLNAFNTNEDCVDDTWKPTASGFPPGRSATNMIWTGTEMIVWGGSASGGLVSTGLRYNPTTDSWTSTSNAGAPGPRMAHSAVWTGTEMIVWGGHDPDFMKLSDGARYNPNTDTWRPLSSAQVPDARSSHTAVWTGAEMIIWGGQTSTNPYATTGARYNPDSDQWAAIATTNAPTGRAYYSAVWSGTEMIIWGGFISGEDFANTIGTGARYNPVSNSWTATSVVNAAQHRYDHSAVWTGSEMIVWGGSTVDAQENETLLNTGARYNPVNDSWSNLNVVGAPQPRRVHKAVWSGSVMIVWGGFGENGSLTSGGRYNPASNSWAATSSDGAPSARNGINAVWTGTEMIIWGGVTTSAVHVGDGARYNPANDSWIAISTIGPPEPRYRHTAVWTGVEMLVWGGFKFNRDQYLGTGGRYNAALDSWEPITMLNAPEARANHTAIWTGTEMIVWGGDRANLRVLATGGRYNPSLDTWTVTNVTDAPQGRQEHSAVWTGSQMIIWGGYDPRFTAEGFNTGARYDPSIDHWVPISNAPIGRLRQTAVWTGSEMLVWGGNTNGFVQGNGARYRLNTDSWEMINNAGAPEARMQHSTVWTGTEMIVWGGFGSSDHINTGGRYNPVNDTWAAVTNSNAPSKRAANAAVWTGAEMIIWGGFGNNTALNDGGRYHAATDTWTPTTQNRAPQARFLHSGVWTGSEMIVWGGQPDFSTSLNSGARYCADAPAAVGATISIDDVSVSENAAGSTASFTVTLSSQSPSSVTVDYATADDSATAAGNDYTSTSGTLTFTPNETSKTINVTVSDDTLFETEETFFVNLTNPSNATIQDGQGTATITSDDAMPAVSISDSSVLEGQSGTTMSSSTVTLSAASGVETTINYSTADDTATTPTDYIAASGALTIPAGGTSGTITVAVNGDQTLELNETFFVNLGPAVNATIADAQGVVTIQADDPSIIISDVSKVEGKAGKTNFTFTVTRSSAASFSSTVRYTTANQSATAGSDYVAKSGTVTIAAGATTATFNIQVNGDRTGEPNEVFVVNLSNAVRAFIQDAQGTGTIVNDD